MQAGLNLYSVRNLIKTEEGLLSTAQKLKEAGYAYLQYSGAPFDAEAVGRASRKAGMPIVLTHVPLDRILDDSEKLCAEHLSIGCKNIGLGSMDRKLVNDEDECKKFIEKLDAAGKRIENAGCKFFYHHHQFEFRRFASGETVMNYMLANTSHINFTVDTYWLQYGGMDIMRYIENFRGRMGCVHLKDYRINAEFAPEFAPVGDGVTDFPAIIKKMKELGTEYFLVEQDDAVSRPDPMGEVTRSVNYLKGVRI